MLVALAVQQVCRLTNQALTVGLAEQATSQALALLTLVVAVVEVLCLLLDKAVALEVALAGLHQLQAEHR